MVLYKVLSSRNQTPLQKGDAMIHPTHNDVGRKVTYTPSGVYPDKLVEEGIITAFNDRYVWVRFGGSVTGAACDRKNLDWLTS